MYDDLPPHLQNLNAISVTPPAVNQEAETQLWDYLNHDELWNSFGVHPSAFENKLSPRQVNADSGPSSTPVQAQEAGKPRPVDLASFVKAFGNEAGSFHVPLGLNFAAPTPAAPADSVAPTPAAHAGSVDYDRITGAKKLKQVGAGQDEIEEDKRRRNTEASARFRAKKREREQALEQRAKDLEAQVAKLAAEKESLENENRLLKAIVLVQQPNVKEESSGSKRKRD